MAAPVASLPPLKLAAGPSPVTPEVRYWKSFRSPNIVASLSNSPITYISTPGPPARADSAPGDYFAVTTGTRVQIYSIRSRKLVKTITRFSDVAHGAEIRPDGQVLVAGDDTGAIQVFNTGSRAILKTWKEHKQPVWTTKFSPKDLTMLMSTSDDCTMRTWDLVNQDSTATFTGHTDYVRSGAFMPGKAADLLVSGSYDQTVKLWDHRASSSAVMSFKHAAPVEAVLPMPSGTTILAAAGNRITVLDIVGGKPIHVIQNHQKTVTSLSLASHDSRVVSGALDGHVKVFETTGWNNVYGVKYPSPVLAVSIITAGLGREDRHIAVGLQSGLLSIKTRLSGQLKIKEKERQKEMNALLGGKLDEYDKKRKRQVPSGIRRRLRGMDFGGEGADVIIQGNPSGKRKNLKQWEHALRNANYTRALDLALALRDPVIAATALTALRHRSAMRAALSGRDEATLQPVLEWVRKHMIDPRYVSLCVEVGTLILDIYSSVIGQSKEVDRLIARLHKQTRKEVEGAHQAWQTDGMLSLLMKT
ncbi:MAG: hypothetical protein LQ340_006145 [Diploschistes diacapsis]|nr:MAG: hypothetical protein LQ340_006145 [Diploschistes diacapsis]